MGRSRQKPPTNLKGCIISQPVENPHSSAPTQPAFRWCVTPPHACLVPLHAWYPSARSRFAARVPGVGCASGPIGPTSSWSRTSCEYTAPSEDPPTQHPHGWHRNWRGPGGLLWALRGPFEKEYILSLSRSLCLSLSLSLSVSLCLSLFPLFSLSLPLPFSLHCGFSARKQWI